MKTWTAKNTGDHQGLIVDDDTGRSVAVSYDKADAPLLAAAPQLLEALQALYNAAPCAKPANAALWNALQLTRAAIAAAEGRA